MTVKGIILPGPGQNQEANFFVFTPYAIITMDKQPFLDRSLLIPIGISIFSILGIGIALATVYLDKPETVAPATLTVTPFKFTFLGTETAVPSLELETTPSEEAFPEEPSTPVFTDTPQAELGTSTLQATASSPTSPLASSTSQTSPTSSTASLTGSNRYDNVDPLLEYDGDWVGQTNVTNAYQGTLVLSKTIGNDLIFSFTGQRIIIGYLGQAGLGSMAISIDDQEFQLNQSAGREWASPQFSNEEHLVIITHESGQSVNLDYINVVGPN